MKDTITREFNEPAVKGHRHGSTFPRNGFTERLELAEVSWRVDRTSLGAVCAGPVCTGCTTSKSIKGELPPAHYPQIFRTGCPSPAQKPGLLKRQCSVVIVAATCPHSTFPPTTMLTSMHIAMHQLSLLANVLEEGKYTSALPVTVLYLPPPHHISPNFLFVDFHGFFIPCTSQKWMEDFISAC